MQREEKQLELSIDALINQVADLKNSLASFIYKLENEYERLTWPSVLDSFALLSGQLNTLNKVLKNEKTPLLRNQVLIPLILTPDRDDEILQILLHKWDGRIRIQKTHPPMKEKGIQYWSVMSLKSGTELKDFVIQ
ncbi:mediator of RNA polymerase II transcription subunit 8-like, partial [Microcaecilia unicolor]|uniref:Mediator of RNA polymerase II transcription subunit 8 n=1 Tax=Microcaecilia unicolor TaxID=1415580 RepID=A0A6P7X2Q9_9AMPH